MMWLMLDILGEGHVEKLMESCLMILLLWGKFPFLVAFSCRSSSNCAHWSGWICECGRPIICAYLIPCALAWSLLPVAARGRL